MRIILFSGKGGVGKTTVAAATSLLCAKFGYKTLIVSVDQAHSLSDSFNERITHSVTKLTNNLYAQEIDIQYQLEKEWDIIKSSLTNFLLLRGKDEIEAEELAIIPGIEELFTMIELKKHINSGKFDVIILDSAPTASSLRLLNFSDIIKWYINNVFKAVKDSDIIELVDKINDRAADIKELLLNKNKTTVRVVLTPDNMAIRETQRNFTYLNLFDFKIDCVIINKILPKISNDSYLIEWKKIQEKYIKLINEVFSPIPIFEAPLFEEEIKDKKLLTNLSKIIYKEDDPLKIFFDDKLFEFTKTEKGYIMKLKLPFITKEDINLLSRNNELIIRIGSYKKNILLPDSLVTYKNIEAELVNEWLHIYFS